MEEDYFPQDDIPHSRSHEIVSNDQNQLNPNPAPNRRLTKKRKTKSDPKQMPEENLDEIIDNFFEDDDMMNGAVNYQIGHESAVGVVIAGEDDQPNIEPNVCDPEESYHSEHSSDEENEELQQEAPLSDEFCDFVEETASMYTYEDSQNPQRSKVHLVELKSGHIWASIDECRDSLKSYAVANKFEIYYAKNESTRIRGLCKIDGCPWKVNIRRAKDKVSFVLKHYVSEHTCMADGDSKNMLANARFVASHFEEIIKTHHQTFRPRDIIDRAWSDLNVNISYHVAWRARDMVLEKMFGNYEDSYAKLPELCNQVLKTNPNSIAFCSIDESNNAFTGLCIAFRASLAGFVNGCRPLVGLDGCFLKGKFGGQCLSMNALDGNNGLFPLAIFICSAETYFTWSTFLNNLKPYLTKHRSLISFISDRQKGLIEAVRDVFPNSQHRFCFKHMYKNFKKQYKGDELEVLSWGASKSYKVSAYEDYMNQIRAKNEDAHKWLAENDPRQWSRSHFDFTTNCEHVSNNFSESFNQWIGKLRDRPVTNFVEKYHLLLMTCLFVRRNKCMNWDINGLVPRAVAIIEEHRKDGMYTYKAAASTKYIYSVQHILSDDRETVDIEKWTCSCRGWQLTGIPCVHAVRVLAPFRKTWVEWCSVYHTVKAYAAVYEDAITPLPGSKDWQLPQFEVLPPVFKRGVGRPKKNRRRDEDDEGPQQPKRKKTCTRCGQSGHNKRRCKGPLQSSGTRKKQSNGNTLVTSISIKKRVRVTPNTSGRGACTTTRTTRGRGRSENSSIFSPRQGPIDSTRGQRGNRGGRDRGGNNSVVP